MPSNNFYRLKQVDIDEQFEYSNVITVKQKDGTRLAMIYPNPVKDLLQIQFYKANRTYHVAVFDAMGKQLFVKRATRESLLTIPVNNWTTGIYTVHITGGAATQTLTFLKQ